VNDPVGKAERVGGVTVVRVVRIEGHDHPGQAGVPGATAAERLSAVFGHAEGIALVAMPVVDVPLEVAYIASGGSSPDRQ
jgi:hypothetical protein